MGRLHALILAGAVALGGTQVAFAADFLPPAPRMDMPLRGTIVDNSGFYVRGDVGYGINTVGPASSYISDLSAVPNLSYDGNHITGGAILGGGFGYQFNNWFRADFTGEWHGGGKWDSRESYDSSGCVNSGTGRCLDLYNAKIEHGVFLANGYVDLGNWSGLTPYLGIGLGSAYHHIGAISDTFPTVSPADVHYSAATSKWKFAWALMAGMSFDISQSLKLDVGYRYLNMGSVNGAPINCNCSLNETQKFKFASHDVRIGLRYVFNSSDAPPPAPMQPLVRKY